MNYISKTDDQLRAIIAQGERYIAQMPMYTPYSNQVATLAMQNARRRIRNARDELARRNALHAIRNGLTQGDE